MHAAAHTAPQPMNRMALRHGMHVARCTSPLRNASPRLRAAEGVLCSHVTFTFVHDARGSPHGSTPMNRTALRRGMHVARCTSPLRDASPRLRAAEGVLCSHVTFTVVHDARGSPHGSTPMNRTALRHGMHVARRTSPLRDASPRLRAADGVLCSHVTFTFVHDARGCPHGSAPMNRTALRRGTARTTPRDARCTSPLRDASPRLRAADGVLCSHVTFTSA